MNRILLFHNRLFDSDELIEGKLVIIDADTPCIFDEYIATSGHPNFQSDGNFRKTGGPIPQAKDSGIKHYTVSTEPMNEPTVEGIKGNFYPISPESVTVGNQDRGEWGIHFDADYPGTLGCIGIKNKLAWLAFETAITYLREAGIKELPLLVSYSK
jgi:hypothetical protein